MKYGIVPKFSQFSGVGGGGGWEWGDASGPSLEAYAVVCFSFYEGKWKPLNITVRVAVIKINNAGMK